MSSCSRLLATILADSGPAARCGGTSAERFRLIDLAATRRFRRVLIWNARNVGSCSIFSGIPHLYQDTRRCCVWTSIPTGSRLVPTYSPKESLGSEA